MRYYILLCLTFCWLASVPCAAQTFDETAVFPKTAVTAIPDVRQAHPSNDTAAIIKRVIFSGQHRLWTRKDGYVANGSRVVVAQAESGQIVPLADTDLAEIAGLTITPLGTPLNPSRLASNGHAVKVASIMTGYICLLYTSPSPRDRQKSRMPSSA